MYENTINATKTLYDMRQTESTKKIVDSVVGITPVAAGVNLDNITLSECNT